MHRLLTFRRLSVLFGLVAAVVLAGLLTFRHFWIDPGERCVRDGNWYDIETRICARPVSIAEITGRPEGQSREEASREKNRELVRIEQGLRDQRRARDAEIEAERARLRD